MFTSDPADDSTRPSRARSAQPDGSGSTRQDARAELPQIELPKGGGAIRGMEEKLQANPATGSVSVALPIPVGAARQGAAPALALQYDSGAGNGPFGLGWRLSLPSVRRSLQPRLPRYRDAEDSDVFLLDGAEKLTPMLELQADGAWNAVLHQRNQGGIEYRVRRYRLRVESEFRRIERWSRLSDGDVHWRTVTSENTHTVYGLDPEARIADPQDPGRVFEWLAEYSYDDRGNCIRFAYKPEDLQGVPLEALHERNRVSGRAACSNRYVKSVRYGNLAPYRRGEDLPEEFLFENVFDYGEHDDDAPRPAEERPWPMRPDAFSDHKPGFEVRTYRSCRRVLLFHRFPDLGPDPCPVRALEIEYADRDGLRFLASANAVGFLPRGNGGYSRKRLPPMSFDYAPLSWSREVRSAEVARAPQAPEGLSGSRYQWVDLYGEGISGILTETGGAWHYLRNRGGGRFEQALAVDPKPSLGGLAQQRLAIVDLESDGRLTVVQLDDEPRGFFRRLSSGGWEPFQAFASVVNRYTKSADARWLDLNGDGIPELLVDEDDVFAWHASEGAAGLAASETIRKALDEEDGPRVVFADPEQTIFLADMDGDGLTDIVRVRNGEVAYWSNQGYGRFSAKVAMSGAPRFDHPERFDPRAIRLADVDGSGCADVLYVERDAVRAWHNQNGNGFAAAPSALGLLPEGTRQADVRVIDFLGRGTACLVWSSPLPSHAAAPLRYVDLAGGRKPHLLTGYRNGCGREVELEFRSSTEFYLEDLAAGRPWATRLPFPVHCLRKSTTRDRVRGSYFSSEYSYHHGYFDHEEREFGGFGRVDIRDSESFEHFARNAGPGVVEEPLVQAPVLTRTWFHTGAALEDSSVSALYAHEFFENTALQEHPLPAPSLPEDLSVRARCEARRAYRGRVLRTETYALDGSPEEPFPYSASQASYELRQLQPPREGACGVFQLIGRESLSYQYDRNPTDPRVSHDLVLEADDLGNVLRSASVVYPRRDPDTSLPEAVRVAQSLQTIQYGERSFTDDHVTEASHRLRAPYESRQFEVLGIAPGDGAHFRLAELEAALAAAEEIGLEAPASGSPQKRLLAHERQYYLRDDLSGPMPLGEHDSLGLSHRQLRLAFTDSLLEDLYGPRVTPSMLSVAGYLQSEGDGAWWLPSGTLEYPADAAAHFYLPTGNLDPFGNRIHSIGLDPFDLLPEWAEDALGNRVTAENDYRVLAPRIVTDPNGSRSAVETDELGLVVRTALLGREGADEGDTLADPTTRVEYALDSWRLSGVPNHAHYFAREEHGPENPRWQERYDYSDGSGQVLLSKLQAEPGLARRVDPATGSVGEVDTTPALRWIGNGRTILNNKGKPVKQYEPYFSVGPQFESEAELVETGSTPLLYYDPIGRLVRSELPEGTFARTEFGPWQRRVHDPQDTVLESRWYAEHGSPDPAGPEPQDPDRRAAWLAARHAGTPSATHKDAFGRNICTIEDNGPDGKRSYRAEIEASGRDTRMFDSLGREIAHARSNLLGAPCYGESAETGIRRILVNAVGNLHRLWEGSGREVRVEYDELHRPLSTYSRRDGEEVLIQRSVYGEQHPESAARRLRGRVWSVFDQAGRLGVESYDFKGSPQSVQRRFALDYEETLDWTALAELGPAAADTAAEPLLDGETWSRAADLDALNRPKEIRLPDGTVVRPTFNEANVLQTLEARLHGSGPWRTFLARQEYDAKGQRVRAELGNGTETRYSYDQDTFQIERIETRRTADGAQLQDLRYVYDPVGNVTEHVDHAQQTLFFDNSVVEPRCRFEYDAIGQLVRASGREHAGFGQPGPEELVLNGLPHANDASAVRNFTEEYEYDSLGNILAMRHAAPNGSWTRRYRYAHQEDGGDRTNRLSATSLPGDPEAGPYSAAYGYDARGNLTSAPHLAAVRWDHWDQLCGASLPGGDELFCVHDAGRQRVRKVVRKSGKTHERLYLGGVEIYRVRSAAGLELERRTVHLSDDSGRIAQVDTKTVDASGAPGTASPAIRYVHGNHLGSATLETDSSGNLLAYEEYHPFGTSAYRSGRSQAETSLRRYRFAGKERDEETGFYCFGARHYAAWLGRWINPDPAGLTAGPNLYRYVLNNPVRLVDPSGTQEDNPQTRFRLPIWMNSEADPEQVGAYARELGYEFSGVNSGQPEYRDNAWQFGTFTFVPFGDPLNILNTPDSSAIFGVGQSMDVAEGGGEVSVPYRADPAPAPDPEPEVEYLPGGDGGGTGQGPGTDPYAPAGASSSGSSSKIEEPGFWVALIPVYGSGKSAAYNFQEGNYGWGTFYTVLAVTDVFLVRSLVTSGGKIVWKGGSMLLARRAAAKEGVSVAAHEAPTATRVAAEALAWESRLPGVQVAREGEFWIKRVNPSSNPFMQAWGELSIQSQYDGLVRLGDMATEFTFVNGVLRTRHVGQVGSGVRFFSTTSLKTYLRGSWRMGTPFNDLRPANMSVVGLVFDPAYDPALKAIAQAGFFYYPGHMVMTLDQPPP